MREVRTDRKPRANNRHLKRKIEYPVLRYGWTDHGGLVMTAEPRGQTESVARS